MPEGQHDHLEFADRYEGRGAVGTTRIFWVNQYAVTPDQPGGTRHYEMAAALRSQGYDVRLVASDLNLTSRSYSRRRGPAERRPIHEEVSGVPFIWLPAGEYRRNDWRRAFSMAVFAWHAFVYLWRNIRRGDIVIGSTPQLPAAASARIAAALRGVSFLLEVRDLWPETLVEVSGRATPFASALRVLANGLYRSSAAIIVLAKGSRGPIVRHGGAPERISFIPNGVDLTEFQRPLKAPPPGLEWIADAPTFVYAGAHGPANGLDLILAAALELLYRGRNDVRILLVGDGPEKDRLKAKAQAGHIDNVVFHDAVPKSVIPDVLRRCTGGLMILRDVELFRYGVSPNKLFDYLASDLPVVTNVRGDVADIVESARAGLVVDSSPDALADAILAITDSHSGSSGMAVRYVEEHHDRRRLAEKFAAVIDAAGRGPR